MCLWRFLSIHSSEKRTPRNGQVDWKNLIALETLEGFLDGRVADVDPERRAKNLDQTTPAQITPAQLVRKTPMELSSLHRISTMRKFKNLAVQTHLEVQHLPGWLLCTQGSFRRLVMMQLPGYLPRSRGRSSYQEVQTLREGTSWQTPSVRHSTFFLALRWVDLRLSTPGTSTSAAFQQSARHACFNRLPHHHHHKAFWHERCFLCDLFC